MERVYRLKYSCKSIVAILDNYSSVSDGAFGNGQSGESTGRSSIFKAPFENSIISKADIDAAISSLGQPRCWSTWCKDPEQSPAGYNLTPPQYKIAQYIRGENGTVEGLARELARIA